jgi:serine/threonine-protein kinase
VTLFEMVTGQRLFAGKDDMATLSMVGKALAPTPSSVTDSVPEELEQIVMKALAREPEDRFQSAGDMNDALIGYLAHTAPTYGTRQLAQWMEGSFGREMEQERRTITELLEASNRPGLVEERRRYFSSPMGAAAVARAQVAQKMSLPPPPRSSAGGSVRPSQPRTSGPPALPSQRGASSKPPAAKSQGFTAWKEDEIDSLVDDGFDRISMPPAPRGSDPARSTAPKPAFQNDGQGFEDEATGFYDPPASPADSLPNVPAAQPGLPAPSPAPSAGTGNFFPDGGGGFDEGATQIFFNKDEDIGITELMEEDIEQQQLNPKPLAVHRPGQQRAAPPPAQRSQPPAARSMPPAAQVPAMAARTPTPQPFRQAVPPERTGSFGAATAAPVPAAAAPRRAHTLRMQAVKPQPKDRNLLVWLGAGLILAAAALAAVVWIRNPGAGAIEVRTIPTRAKVVLDGVHRGL